LNREVAKVAKRGREEREIPINMFFVSPLFFVLFVSSWFNSLSLRL